MRLRITTPLAMVGLLLTASICAEAARASREPDRPSPFVTKVGERTFTVSGTVVSARDGSLVVRIDDHRHAIPFKLGSGVSSSKLQAGSRVSVQYHPSGATGQVADEVQVLSGPRGADAR